MVSSVAVSSDKANGQYGRQLTALIIGDKSGLTGQTVHLEGHKGVLAQVDCKEGGI